MAPQQNSTLIDDNLAKCSSILNLPEEELQRYSPILPPKSNLHYQCQSNNNNNCNNNNNENKHNNRIRADNYDSYKRQKNYKSNRNNGGSRNDAARSHKHRSISLYGSNSTVEQGNKELPIWIDDEPRYVSGVTNKTTCNDIIKALIDDEIRSGNLIYCAHTKAKDGAASRDYSDYVITESWRGIERSYEGNMAILPVWKAWSRVHNEIRLSMKHHNDIKDPHIAKSNHSGLSTLRKYFSKLLRFAKFSKKQDSDKKVTKCLLSKNDPIPDEFFLVILPEEKYDNLEASSRKEKNTKEKNKNLKPTTEESAKQAEAKLLKNKLYRLSETRGSIRKRRRASKEQNRKHERKRSNAIDSQACIKRRKDMSIRNSLRNQIARKITDIDRLYAREYTLTKELSVKCKLYKLQNDLYTNPGKNLEISVGQIQRSIENYGEEIIKTEHELLELKNDIKQDISIINKLKRMTIETNSNVCGVPQIAVISKKTGETTPTEMNEPEQMHFVDNIYEFCDNNASMLV